MVELPPVGVGSWIERRARTNPDQAALVWGDRSTTYADLAARIRRLANGLAGLGVGHGDRVAWLGPNHPAFLEAFFASALIGAAVAPANHRLQPDQVHAVLEDTDPAVLIHHGAVDASSVPRSIPHRVGVGEWMDEGAELEALMAESSDARVSGPVSMDDLCFLAHTSGTTGSPKGVMLTHANVTWNVVNFLTSADFRSSDVTVAIAPFFRVGGTGVNVLPLLFVGGTVAVAGDGGADEILRLMERHRVTVGFGNPDILEALVRSGLWARADLSSVRFVLTGGAPVAERLIRAYLDRGVTLLQGYGLSEAGPLALLLDPASALRKVGSAGKPPLLVDVRIVDQHGDPVPPGETGELLVRGPNVMPGYWRRPEATREVLSIDGWLRTGDAARSDDESFVWIVDRVADSFLVEGRVVHPGDIERVLGQHPSIAEAGVAQIDSPARGLAVVAFVVPSIGSHPTEQDVLAFCGQHLPAHQVPASAMLVDRLPRNPVGKLIRSQLRDLLTEQARS